MALKDFYDDQESIPEGERHLYVERNGRWDLDRERGEGERNAEDVRRAQRARDNEKAEREKLRAELDALREKLEGIDLEDLPTLKEAASRAEEAEHQKLIDEKKFEEAAAKRFERRIAEMQRTAESQKQAYDDLQARMSAQRETLQSVMIEGALQQEFLAGQADPKKLRYLLLDAKQKWELDPETNEPIPIDYIEGGKTKVTAMGKDSKPLTMKEHVQSILAENPWAVLESSGSRAQHQAGSPQNGFTLTESQAQDFNLYKQAKAQAEQAGAEITVVPG